jgi:hypothetical protein
MDELKALHLTAGDWWRLGVVVFVFWLVTAALEGSSMFALVAVPLLVGFWVYAILVIDHWVGKRN